MKVLLQIHVSVLLVIYVLGNAQKVSASDKINCNGTHEYLLESLNKCCSRCAPGSYVKKECDENSDTQCQECEYGTYTPSWNFAESCRICRPCPPHLVMTKNCSRSNREKCECPKGYNCTQSDGVGKCLVCKPILLQEPLVEPTTTGQIISYPIWVIPAILALVAVVFAAIVAVTIQYIRRNNMILEKFGCIPKIRSPEPETTVVESQQEHLQTATQPLMFHPDPPHPIQESDPQQSAAYTLTPHTGVRMPPYISNI